jgi:hypothetical protein
VSQLPSGSPLPQEIDSSNRVVQVTAPGLRLQKTLFSTVQLRCLELNFEGSTPPHRFVVTVDNRPWWVELRHSQRPLELVAPEGRPLLLVQ